MYCRGERKREKWLGLIRFGWVWLVGRGRERMAGVGWFSGKWFVIFVSFFSSPPFCLVVSFIQGFKVMAN